MKMTGQTTAHVTNEEFRSIKDALEKGKCVMLGPYQLTLTNYIAVNISIGRWEISIKNERNNT